MIETDKMDPDEIIADEINHEKIKEEKTNEEKINEIDREINRFINDIERSFSIIAKSKKTNHLEDLSKVLKNLFNIKNQITLYDIDVKINNYDEVISHAKFEKKIYNIGDVKNAPKIFNNTEKKIYGAIERLVKVGSVFEKNELCFLKDNKYFISLLISIIYFTVGLIIKYIVNADDVMKQYISKFNDEICGSFITLNPPKNDKSEHKIIVTTYEEAGNRLFDIEQIGGSYSKYYRKYMKYKMKFLLLK